MSVKFLELFTKIDSAEDCPLGVDLLLWDGCDFSIDYADVEPDTGCYYFANGTEGIAYFEIPSQVECALALGDGESES